MRKKREPLIARPIPGKVYLRRELRPPAKAQHATAKDTFHIRPINVVRLNPLVIVEVK